MSVGYSLALMLLFGSLMGFINSSQQIFFDVFGLPQMFPLIFAALVSMMAVTSLLNARFVEEVGTRRISHAGLIGRSEEHTSELQSLMRISYAVFCLKKKTKNTRKMQT